MQGDKPQSVVILGSTGSIGTQALEVVAAHRDKFRVTGLAAGGGNIDVLAQQIISERPSVVALDDETKTSSLQDAVIAAGVGRGGEWRGVWDAMGIDADSE